MADEIGFENGRNSNFQGLVTLTLTLDPAIRHTVVHQSSTSTYIPNFIQIEETFCGGTDVRTDGHFSPYIIRSTFGSWPKNNEKRSETRKHCALPMQAGSVLHLCIKFEADSCIRSKVIRGSKISKFGHVTQATSI